MTRARISERVLRERCAEIQAELKSFGAERFPEIGRRYDSYAIDDLSPDQLSWREGKGPSGASGVQSTFASGLTAREAWHELEAFRARELASIIERNGQ